MKKRLLSAILSFCMLLTMAPTVAFAADEDNEGNTAPAKSGTCGAEGSADSVKWALTDDDGDGSYTLTISGSGAMVDFTSPTAPNAENANIAPWYTALTADETTNLVPITEIKIDEGITGIGSYAFAYTKVAKAEFPSTASYYGKYIFRYCSELTTVDWTNYNPAPMDDTYVPGRPEGIYVPEGMFDFCESLKQCKVGETTYDEGVLALPENVTGICTAAFRDTAFNAIDFSSDGLKQIAAVGPYAFAQTKITSVIIPANVDFYPQASQLADTFNGCTSLTSVTFADDVTKIPGSMFSGCAELNSVSINKENSQISEIGAYAFSRCSKLTSFTFPTGLKTIGKYAFERSGVTSIDLGEVENLAGYSFFGCKDLAEVKIVGTPGLEIESTTFGTYTGYPSAAPIKKFTLENGTLTAFSSAAVDSLEELHFGDGVTEIPACSYGTKQDGNWVIVGAKKLKTVTLGKNITNLPANAFRSSQLTEITIPDSVTSIGINAFNGCESLETVTIRKTSQLQSIGNSVFGSTKIKTIYIPANVTSIGQQTFFNSTTLTTVDMSDVESETVNIGAWCFGYDNNVEAANRPLRTFYVSNAGLIDRLTDKDDCNDSKYHGSRVANAAFVVTNGGTVDSSKTGLAAVSKAGYGVTWTSSNGTTVTNPETTTLKSGKTYTAAWTLATGNVEITYNPNISGGNDKNVVRVAVKNSDTDVARELFSRTGYTFTGWNTKADGTGTAYKTGDTIKADTMTLYAQWTLDKPTISGTATAVYGNEVTLTAKTAVTGASYQWYKNGNEIANAVSSSLTLSNVADSGAYTVKITVGTDTATSEPTTVTINKATPTIAISATPDTLTGGGSVELTVSGVPTEDKLAVTCDNDITVNEKDGKYTAQLPNVTKNYTFTAKYTGTDNYNDVEKTCVVKVTRKSSHSSSSGSSTTSANTVSASTASNGKVALDKSTAKKGDTVTVTVTPDAGYQLDKLTVTDAKGKTVDVTKKSDGKYTFTMPDSKVTITPTFSKIEDTKPSKNGFDDVASSDWFADAVKYVADKGLMSGTGSDKFAPSATTTRAMLMTVLARYAGEDTTGGATWYEKGMEWAKAKGVSDGTNPNASITREQLVTMLYRYAGSPKADGKLDSFSDSASVSTYAADAMQWAVANGIVNGSNGKLNPQNNATRAEVAAILMRFCEMSK